MNITLKGKQVTLIGRIIKENMVAPTFSVSNHELKEVSLDDFTDKIKIITTFISLDTTVCDLQVKEFNQRAKKLAQEVVVIGISNDLPFAEDRFCKENTIKDMQVLSDYKNNSFGINYGLLIKEINLLARSVIIIDKNNVIRYIQIVNEITTPPDYEDVITHLKEIISHPSQKIEEKYPIHCEPCERGTPPLPKAEIDKQISTLKNWQLIDDKKLVKEFKFKDFIEAKYFLDLLALIAEEQEHHPNFTLIYNKLKVALTTHASGGLTINDFIMARIIDSLQH